MIRVVVTPLHGKELGIFVVKWWELNLNLLIVTTQLVKAAAQKRRKMGSKSQCTEYEFIE